MVSACKPCLSANGFVHLNRGVCILLDQFSDSCDCVIIHFYILLGKYLSNKDNINIVACQMKCYGSDCCFTRIKVEKRQIGKKQSQKQNCYESVSKDLREHAELDSYSERSTLAGLVFAPRNI